MAGNSNNRRIPTILEYISLDTSVTEQGDEQDPQQGMDPNAAGGDPGMDMMGGDPGMDQGMAGGGMDMGGNPGMDPNAGGADPGMDQGGQAAPPQGFSPQGGDPTMGGADMSMTGGPQDGAQGGLQPDDEVVDIDDLTDSQEDTERKIDILSDKFSKLLDKISAFEDKVDGNDRNIESLKAEIEKRNPTPVEKMTLRSKNAYPFNVTPEEYWDDKEATSNYSTEDDNNGADDEVYKITKSDIDDISNWPEISKGLNNRNGYGLLDILDF